jgi:hypothetical protein
MVGIHALEVDMENRSMKISFQLTEFNKKEATMINDITRSIVSNHFSVESTFGYTANYEEENIYKSFKNRDDIELIFIKYVNGEGYNIGAMYKAKNINNIPQT